MNSVELVWITPDAEKMIAEIARVSNPENQHSEKYKGLIKYLIRNDHWSPFEMACACFKITTTRAISAQMIRHRSFSFQEFSQRYAEPKFDDIKLSIDSFQPRLQDNANRQNSIITSDHKLISEASGIVEDACEAAYKSYASLIELGVARECARTVLPMMAPTTIYMTGSIRSWIHYINLRSSHGTQREHSQIADNIHEVLKDHIPVICELIKEL